MPDEERISTEAGWRIEMLGGLRVILPDGRSVARFRNQKAAALLALLAWRPDRMRSREDVADALWPDADRDTALLRLRVTLHSLRRQVETEEKKDDEDPAAVLFVSSRTGIGLNPLATVSTDVEAFERALNEADTAVSNIARQDALRRAVALYRGDLLAGFYEEWVHAEREHLAERHAAARRALDRLQEGSVAAAPRAVAPDAPPPPVRRSYSPPLLPPRLTRFFGREVELLALVGLLDPDGPERARLITLGGPGGVGKTRLAIEAAERAVAPFTTAGGAVVFVPLADLTDAAQIPDEIARRLGLPPTPATGNVLDRIIAALNSRSPAPSLLVLDNAEHLLPLTAPEKGSEVVSVEGLTALVCALLAQAPDLTLLVTSRQRLALEGEHVFSVSPLPVPVEDAADPGDFPAVALFVDRARVARPDFALTARGAPAVVALVARLEGLPLALELAAAWASLLTPVQMLSRLEEGEAGAASSALLASRERGRAVRHRSLVAALEGSVARLPDPLRRFWVGLSVFRGGFTAEAGAAVVAEQAIDSLTALGALLDRSLLTAEEDTSGGGMRYRLLESLRQYAAASLTSDEALILRRRHLAHFAEFAQRQAPELQSGLQADALALLEAEEANLRAALDFALENAEAATAGDGLRLAAAIREFWLIRGRLTEGRRYLNALLDRTAPAETDASVLGDAWEGAGSLAQAQSDLVAADAAYAEALRIAQDEGDDRRAAAALSNRGLVAELSGEFARAATLHEQALSLRRTLGDRRGEAASLNNLGVVAQQERRLEDARRFYRESLAIKRELGEQRAIANAHNNLGNIAHALDEYAESRHHHGQALALRRELGDRPGVAASLNNLGMVAATEGDARAAHALFAESLTVKRELGDRIGIARTLFSLGRLVFEQGSDLHQAARYLEECVSLQRTTGMTNRQDIAAPLHYLMRLAAKNEEWARVAYLSGATDSLLLATGRTRRPDEENEYVRLRARAGTALSGPVFDPLDAAGRAASLDTLFRVALREEGLPDFLPLTHSKTAEVSR